MMSIFTGSILSGVWSVKVCVLTNRYETAVSDARINPAIKIRMRRV